MLRKRILLLLSFIIFSVGSFAQDKIIKKNGEIIEAKVSVINQDNVIFKRFDNLDGPEYSIPKADVARIKYPNGTEDIFEDDNDKIGVKRHDSPGLANRRNNDFGVLRNILSIVPLAATDGLGIGASIEHVLDNKGVVNFYMPVLATFQNNTNEYSGGNVTNTMVYFMPGIKIYTNLNTRRKLKFSIGPSVLLGVGNGMPSNNIYYNGTYADNSVSRFTLGALANIGLNFFPTQHVHFAVDYGVGAEFINNYGGVSEGFGAIEVFSINIGYRF